MIYSWVIKARELNISIHFNAHSVIQISKTNNRNERIYNVHCKFETIEVASYIILLKSVRICSTFSHFNKTFINVVRITKMP